MTTLKIYKVKDKYVRFLHSRDNRVQLNKNQRRPYVGVVLLVGSYKYFVPMESPKPNHAKIKPGPHIHKMDGGALGLLGFNNMIPVCDDALISFDIDAEPDTKYAELLRRQAAYINRNKSDIFSRAAKTYYSVTTNKNKFLVSISCDFLKLEKACKQYDPKR